MNKTGFQPRNHTNTYSCSYCPEAATVQAYSQFNFEIRGKACDEHADKLRAALSFGENIEDAQ